MAFTISDYVIERLKQQGVDTLFGVPSVYCASLYFAAENAANFSAIVTSSDLEAGYAADGYARMRGLSAVAVSYGPGTLSLANAIAGAYVERSPIVVINGGPSDKNIRDQTTTGVLYSHSMGRPHTDMEVFQPLTAFCERVTDATLIPGKVDQAIRIAITRKHPVYLEIPQAMLGASTSRPTTPLDLSIPPGAAAKTANAILKAIKAAKAPVLIIGIEVQRYGLDHRQTENSLGDVPDHHLEIGGRAPSGNATSSAVKTRPQSRGMLFLRNDGEDHGELSDGSG